MARRIGTWGVQLQFPEQPADVALVVADAELLLDHLGDAGTGPDLAPEPVRLRPVPEELGDQALLSGREFGRNETPGLEVARLYRSKSTAPGC